MSETKKKGPGRPKGSRNKSSLLEAQLFLDKLTPKVAKTWEALLDNDKEFLNCKDDVPYSIRFSAGKEIMSKSLANESSKEPVKQPETAETEDGKVVHTGPQVFSTAK